jgi:hypothetical protein
MLGFKKAGCLAEYLVSRPAMRIFYDKYPKKNIFFCISLLWMLHYKTANCMPDNLDLDRRGGGHPFQVFAVQVQRGLSHRYRRLQI